VSTTIDLGARHGPNPRRRERSAVPPTSTASLIVEAQNAANAAIRRAAKRVELDDAPSSP